MKRFTPVLFLAVLLLSCDKGEGYYSYLSDPEVKAEAVKMKFAVSSVQSGFNYTIQAKEMVIDWGDGSRLSEYVFFDDTDNTDAIKAITYPYASVGAYEIEVKALQLKNLLLSRSGENMLTELSLTDCLRLRNLFCDNQPISELDVSGCPELRILSCGYPDGELSLIGVAAPRKLGELYIKGPLTSKNLELANSDSLRIIRLENTNLPDIQLSNLPELRTIEINSCPDMENVYIGNNSLLSEVVLINNTSLDFEAINRLFENLPSANSDSRYITLSGNKGDDKCNKSLATSKGWIFR